MTKEEKIKKKFEPLIGCPTSFNTKTGFLIIYSKAKVFKINHGQNLVGMVIAVWKGNVAITFNGAFVDALMNPKHIKII